MRTVSSTETTKKKRVNARRIINDPVSKNPLTVLEEGTEEMENTILFAVGAQIKSYVGNRLMIGHCSFSAPRMVAY